MGCGSNFTNFQSLRDNHLLNRLRELVSFQDVFGEVSVGEEVSSFVYLLLDAEEERRQ